jgi:MFS family permease
MIRRLLQQRDQLGELFSAVKGNARVLVITEGISAVSFQWYTTYLALYMVALGVSEVEVGLLAGILIFTQFVSTLFGGYFADRFGRKRVLVVFDIICWGVPMALYAVARNPWYFLAGRFINGFVYIVVPGFECLFVEDVPAERRAAVFGMLQFLTAAASLLAPVAGFLVAWLGIIPAGRLIMAINMVIMVGIAIARQFTLHETSMGQERMSAIEGVPLLALAREYGAAVRTMAGDRRVAIFLVVRNLVAFTAVMWGTYAAIYLTDATGIGLPKSFVGFLPFVSALATLGMILLAASRVGSAQVFGNLVGGQVVWLVAAACFVLSPAGMVGPAVLWTALAAISTTLFQPASQSYWANIVADRERATVFSASNALMALCTLPAGPLAGALYTLHPKAPFLLGIALQAAVLGLLLTLRPGQEKASWESQAV